MKDLDVPGAHIRSAVVDHAGYGCDSGCCGHTVEGLDCESRVVFTHFGFDHPDDAEDDRTWARSLVNQYLPGVPLNWKESNVSRD